MSDTQNQKISQFTFEQVEQRLQTIKFDQPADHFLNGEGNYVQVTTTGGTPYDDTDIKNDLQDLTVRVDTVETGLEKIGDLDTLNTTAKDTVVNAVNELEGKITNIQQNGYDDTDIKNSIGALTDLTTVEQNSLVGAINELDADKVDKTELDNKANSADVYLKTETYSRDEVDAYLLDKADTTALDAYTTTDDMNLLLDEKADKADLDDLVTLDEVKNEINQAQLGGVGQVDLSIYALKDQIGELTGLSTTEQDTIVGAINEVKTLVDGKANVGTTLAEYGIADAYTKDETDAEIQTKVAEAINNANHLKREIVANVPTDVTEENVIYMYKVDAAKGNDLYQEWMLIDGTPTIIGDTSTDLTDYQKKLVGVKNQVVGFDDAGEAVAVELELNRNPYGLVDGWLPEGSVVDFREKEIRIMCPATTQWVKSGGGDADKCYIGIKAYAPNDTVTKFKEDWGHPIVDQTMWELTDVDAGTGVDPDGRRYSVFWIPAATLNVDGVTWDYTGKDSAEGDFKGRDYAVEWYTANDKLVASDHIRINFSNENCHASVLPFYSGELGGGGVTQTIENAVIEGSDNPVKSDALYKEFAKKKDTDVVVNCMCASTGFSGLTFTSKDKTFTEINDLIVTEKKTVVVELTDTTTTSKYILYYRGANNRLDGGIFTNTNSHDFYGSAKIDGVEKTIILKVNSDDSVVLELSTNRYVQLFVDCASGGGTFGLMGNLDKTFEEISKEFHAKNIVEVIAWDNTTMTSCLLSIAYVGENLIKFTGIGDFDGVTKRIVLTIDNQNNQNLESVDIGGATIEFDDEPLQDSENAVKSGGVFTELQKKQDKLTGSLGQIIGFDANGNAVAREYEITPDWATFIVEDNATLEKWRTKASGGDYERVYIRKNTYRITDLGVVTNGKYFVFNLTTIGTKKIYAEEGTILRFVGAYLNDTVVEIGYEECPSDLEEYSAEGLTILAEIDSSGNNFSPSCFYNMVNLTNCTAKSSCYAKSNSTSINAIGYNQCKNLIRCSSSMSSGKRSEATAHVGALVSLGYKDCDKLLQCSGEAVAISDSGTSKLKMFGYETCKDMVQCVGTVNHKYVVIAIAGQSNAVGYDESPVDIGGKLIYANRDTNRIKQLGFYGEDNLKIIDLGYCAQSMQDMRVNNRVGEENPGTKGIHLPLANLMLDYIPEDYGVLVLPISYGGTGFTSGNNGTYSSDLKKPTETDPKASQGGQGTAILKWGTGTAYYQTLRDRIIHVLELNDENLFAGIIWCQGENDMNNATGHKSGFEAMTQLLFDELNAHNSGALKARTPRGTFDKNIWYNMETVGYWYTQGQCQTIWDNYRTWNADTYVEIPRDTESNDVNGTGSTAGVRDKHYGNNAYQKVIAPRVLQKMIDMNTFTKKVNVISTSTEITNDESNTNINALNEDERLISESDVIKKSTGTVLTVDVNGNCTANKELRNSYTTDKTHIIFKDFYKMDFKVSRSMYWLVIEQDADADSVVVVGFGKSYTTRIVQITKGTISQTPIKEADGSKNKTFHKGHRIRVYREPNGNVIIYEKGNSGIWHKWLEISSPNVLKEKVFGFCAGIAGNEFSDSFTTDDMKLFEDMSVWEATSVSTSRQLDMRLTSIEYPYNKYKEERDAISEDIVSQSSGSTFSLNGSKNIVASATIDTTKVQKVYLKDVFKLEFNVNRAIYYLVLRKNSTNDDVLVCEIGGSNTGRISTINTTNQKTVLVDSTAQYTLEGTDKIRIYRDGNGSVHAYLKKQNNAWGKVATISVRHEFDKQLFGFVVGLGTDETNSSIGASDTLLSSLKVWETEPFPLARLFDIRLSNLEP